MKDEKQHDTADKSTSKQQVCISDGSCFHCAKIWTHTPSASGSYGRPAVQSADKSLVVLKSYNSTSAFFGYFRTTSCCTNSLTVSFSNDDYYKLGFVGAFFGKPYFSLSIPTIKCTTVLNDAVAMYYLNRRSILNIAIPHAVATCMGKT